MNKLYCIPCRLLGLPQIEAFYIVNGFSCCKQHEEMWEDGTMNFNDGEPVDYDIEKWRKEKVIVHSSSPAHSIDANGDCNMGCC